ncbi:MAG: phage baseplate assembly protein V [Myxococcota bacterium]
MTAELGQRYFGVYLGTVVAVDDPDGLGRVRIETDQYEDTDEDPTWAPVARPMAGSATTVFFSPVESDQVLVSYLAGDVRQPVVTGYIHTTENKPDDADHQKHTLRVDGLGSITFDEEASEIRIQEGEGASGVTITLKNGKMTVQAKDMAFQARDTFCVNGEAVVLKPFLQSVFDSHTHGLGTATTTGPAPPSSAVPTSSTRCGS